MATHVFDEKHDGTLRVEKVRQGLFHCELSVGLRTGELTKSTFTGEGPTEKRASENAIAKAAKAIQLGQIEY